jgi:predicted enzyme related to lactoylglutathione lyase
MGNPVTWFEINSPDSVALRDFYADLFGWQVQPFPGDPPYALVDTGSEGAIGGGIGDTDGPSRASTSRSMTHRRLSIGY